MLYRLENAEGEITVLAMVGVGWLGEGGNFVTPIGSPTATLTSRTAPTTGAGRSFRDRIGDFNRNPGRWETISTHTEQSTR
jgi:hypothetical protein